MKVRRRGELIRLRLDHVESMLLTTLLGDLIEILVPDALEATDPVRQRLFPAGYRDDDEAAAEFRALTESTLQTERADRARQCAAELAAAGNELELSDESGQRWIQVVNDVRLALGTRLDITEDSETDSAARIDPDDPDARQRAIYFWLTGVQDSLVRALMR